MRATTLVPLGVLVLAGLGYIVLTDGSSDPSEAVASQVLDTLPGPPAQEPTMESDLEPLDSEVPRSSVPVHPEAGAEVAPIVAVDPVDLAVDETSPGARKASAARENQALLEEYHRRVGEIGTELHERGEYERFITQPGEEFPRQSSGSVKDQRPTVMRGKTSTLPDGRVQTDITRVRVDDHPDLVRMYDELKALGVW